jgi:hypothetical protein
MRWRDIVRKETGTEPVEAAKPLTLAASHKRAKRQDTINRQDTDRTGHERPHQPLRTKLEDA